MNKKKAIALCVGLTSLCAQAYETATHRILNRHAVQRSILATDPTLLSDLGLLPFSQVAYSTNVSGGQMTATDIIAFGGEYEDSGARPLNHFYDPQYNRPFGRGLELRPLSQLVGGVANPDWALEDNGDINPGDPACGQLNDCTQIFSFKRGQRALYDSLVLEVPSARLEAASRALQIVGQVTHLLQDMAQPQHTRNDQHLHPMPVTKNNPQWAIYELWTESQNASIDTMLAGQPGYPIPRFGTARSYWHSADMAQARYVGMAEFTSYNYTSYGTQYVGGYLDQNHIGAAPGLALPDGTLKLIKRLPTKGFVTPSGVTVAPGYADFVVGQIKDEFTNTSSAEVKLASTSLLWSFLSNPVPKWGFVENTEVYRDHHKVLLPRAVAFSAGLINHFFRGRLSIEADGRPNYWKVINTGKEAMDGTFVVYSEDEFGWRRQIFDSATRASVMPGASTTLYFTPPSGTKKLVAVFHGRIGEEGEASGGTYFAVAGKIVPYTAPPEITFKREPLPMVAGKSYSVNYTVKQATSGSYSCTPAQTGGMQAYGSLSMGTGTIPGTASSDWVGKTSSCTYSATGLGGTTVVNETNITTVAAPPPAVPCGQVVKSGSSAGLDVIQEMGSTAGKVLVNFEAFDIPDGLVITADNTAATVLTTTNGLVSGTKALSFNHDPVARGTTKVRLKVTGNSNAGTIWNVGSSCPGQPAPGTTAVPIRFGLEGPSAIGECSIGYTLKVDGITRPFPGTVSLSPSESHSYTLVVTQAFPNNPCPYYKYPYYYNSLGKYQMYSGPAQYLQVR